MIKKSSLKKAIFLFILLSTKTINAQIGINTAEPKGILHLDGKIDNSSVITSEQSLNDFVISTDGNIGIGTISPQNKLEINSGSSESNSLRFMNLNSTSQTIGNIKAIGVDINGDIVLMERPALNVLPGNCIQPYALVRGVSSIAVNLPTVKKGYVISKDFSKNANSVAGTQPNIIFNEETGTFKLKAGNTYKLEGAVLAIAGNDSYIQSRWKINPTDLTGEEYIGNTPRSSSFTGSNAKDGDQGRSVAIYTAKFDTEVGLVIHEAPGISSYYPQNSYALVTQINPCKLQPES